jgi:hypothetical protein
MRAPAKLAAFAAVLALLFGVGVLAGELIGPDRDTAAAQSQNDRGREGHTGMSSTTTTTAEPHGSGGHEAKADQPVRGLALAQNGLRLVVEDSELRRGRTEGLAFRIVDDSGATVRKFDVEHEKRMHLIVARRDLTGFQHLHPKQADDGSWTTTVRLDEAGSYRLFADFARDGQSYTLASDLRVDGFADLKPLPAAQPTAVSDGGYHVRLNAGRARPGEEAELRFTVTEDGETVHTEPYLGAGGHLVALRDGDLAFLHVHPTDDGHDDNSGSEERHDDSVGFAATFPSEGRYRLFLQFKHEGRVQTVAFTQEVK